MGDRAYLSIGEVLSLLKDEFPDVTISKIRFLESQGLLDPERTASGYRKFYDPDVDRLRWILRQQREHFLPLKVIKGRLVGGPVDDTDADDDEAQAQAEADAEVADRAMGGARSHEHDLLVAGVAPEAGPAPAPPGGRPPASPAPVTAPDVTAPPPGRDDQTSPSDRPPAGERGRGDSVLSAGLSGVSLTLEELSTASGLPYDRLRELERYGFIAGRPVAGTVYYDEEALVVANLAAGFARFGIEGRHLRIYKNSAEREAGLFEQIVTPLLKQRNPESRRQAVQALEELTHLGQSLRAAVLRQAVRRLSGG